MNAFPECWFVCRELGDHKLKITYRNGPPFAMEMQSSEQNSSGTLGIVPCLGSLFASSKICYDEIFI